MPELDRGGLFCPPPLYRIGCQNTPYKLGLKKEFMNPGDLVCKLLRLFLSRSVGSHTCKNWGKNDFGNT